MHVFFSDITINFSKIILEQDYFLNKTCISVFYKKDILFTTDEERQGSWHSMSPVQTDGLPPTAPSMTAPRVYSSPWSVASMPILMCRVYLLCKKVNINRTSKFHSIETCFVIHRLRK